MIKPDTAGLFRGFTGEVGIYDWEKPNTWTTWKTYPNRYPHSKTDQNIFMS